MRWRTALLLTTAVVCLVAGIGRAAAPSILITTEDGSTLLNAPMLPAEAGIQLNGHIDGLASSDAALNCAACSITVTVGGESGSAALECDDIDCKSGSWVFFLPFPLLPGDYTATATVTDADGATASDDISVTVM